MQDCECKGGGLCQKKRRHATPLRRRWSSVPNDLVEIFSFYRKAGVFVIGVYAISDKGRLEIQELDLTREGLMKKLRYNRLRELNMRGEGIYFAPKTDACNMLFLDDPVRLEGLPLGTMVVQTSQKKHQCHIPYVGQPAQLPLRTRFQKHLRSIYDADKGAVSANHPRRLPEFVNQKYPDKPLVKILYTVEKGRPLFDAALIEAVRKQETERIRRPPRLFSSSRSKALKKQWSDFYDGSDKSVADMKYTLYLLRKGVDEAEIRERLIHESLDIKHRKKGHLDDYLDRTIRVAKSYIQ